MFLKKSCCDPENYWSAITLPHRYLLIKITVLQRQLISSVPKVAVKESRALIVLCYLSRSGSREHTPNDLTMWLNNVTQTLPARG